ncbi:hypothetical protein BD626DRAFT_78830 [Schizophyllum amplum]|uniref:Uncharacterized protein n=1 Tax=Schizophyllum amplum TaxID=97359 RepID=A0A550C9L8_9AGAR|nr:hypothetical protein BD626DRAFT_78830 [Auriculariopsis ampla]
MTTSPIAAVRLPRPRQGPAPLSAGRPSPPYALATTGIPLPHDAALGTNTSHDARWRQSLRFHHPRRPNQQVPPTVIPADTGRTTRGPKACAYAASCARINVALCHPNATAVPTFEFLQCACSSLRLMSLIVCSKRAPHHDWRGAHTLQGRVRLASQQRYPNGKDGASRRIGAGPRRPDQIAPVSARGRREAT